MTEEWVLKLISKILQWEEEHPYAPEHLGPGIPNPYCHQSWLESIPKDRLAEAAAYRKLVTRRD